MAGSEADWPEDEDVAVAARKIWDLYQQADGATFNLRSGSLAG